MLPDVPIIVVYRKFLLCPAFVSSLLINSLIHHTDFVGMTLCPVAASRMCCHHFQLEKKGHKKQCTLLNNIAEYGQNLCGYVGLLERFVVAHGIWSRHALICSNAATK